MELWLWEKLKQRQLVKVSTCKEEITMKYESPIMDVTCFQKVNVITSSDGLIVGDDKKDQDDF